jgi:hypothetical protein
VSNHKFPAPPHHPGRPPAPAPQGVPPVLVHEIFPPDPADPGNKTLPLCPLIRPVDVCIPAQTGNAGGLTLPGGPQVVMVVTRVHFPCRRERCEFYDLTGACRHAEVGMVLSPVPAEPAPKLAN